MSKFTIKVRKFIRILRIRFWRRTLFLHRVAATVEHVHVLENVGEIKTVLDIGANRGQFALAARHVFPQARIISFEPLPEPAAVFRRVFGGDNGVTLLEIAVGAESGDTTIHVSARDDSSSLLPITDMQNELFPGTFESGVTTIRIAPIPEHVVASLHRPAFLKLDVQGFELEALKGSESCLLYIDWIYAECSFVELYKGQGLADEVINNLRQKGFILIGVYNTSYDSVGRAIQADFLFKRAGS